MNKSPSATLLTHAAVLPVNTPQITTGNIGRSIQQIKRDTELTCSAHRSQRYIALRLLKTPKKDHHCEGSYRNRFQSVRAIPPVVRRPFSAAKTGPRPGYTMSHHPLPPTRGPAAETPSREADLPAAAIGGQVLTSSKARPADIRGRPTLALSEVQQRTPTQPTSRPRYGRYFVPPAFAAPSLADVDAPGYTDRPRRPEGTIPQVAEC